MSTLAILGGLILLAFVVKVSRDQHAYAVALRDQRQRFQDYADAKAAEHEHAR